MLTLLYIAFAVLGVGYLGVSLLTGHLMDVFSGTVAGPGAGADVGATSYGVDAGGHGSVSAHESAAAEFHFPLFSPLALAMLFASIGGYGLIAKHGFRVGDAASLLVAVPLAFASAYGVTYAGWRLMQGSRASSAFRLEDLVGQPAEVLTPIPAGGIGEVSAALAGQRVAGPAREAQGREVRRGAVVRVVRVVGATLVVNVDEHGG
jgi:hypothetical protein